MQISKFYVKIIMQLSTNIANKSSSLYYTIINYANNVVNATSYYWSLRPSFESAKDKAMIQPFTTILVDFIFQGALDNNPATLEPIRKASKIPAVLYSVYNHDKVSAGEHYYYDVSYGISQLTTFGCQVSVISGSALLIGPSVVPAALTFSNICEIPSRTLIKIGQIKQDYELKHNITIHNNDDFVDTIKNIPFSVAEFMEYYFQNINSEIWLESTIGVVSKTSVTYLLGRIVKYIGILDKFSAITTARYIQMISFKDGKLAEAFDSIYSAGKKVPSMFKIEKEYSKIAGHQFSSFFTWAILAPMEYTKHAIIDFVSSYIYAPPSRLTFKVIDKTTHEFFKQEDTLYQLITKYLSQFSYFSSEEETDNNMTQELINYFKEKNKVTQTSHSPLDPLQYLDSQCPAMIEDHEMLSGEQSPENTNNEEL